ncbi:MAG: hypothetical protein PVJ42_00685 [bacterium]|jgi:hypothetical protein
MRKSEQSTSSRPAARAALILMGCLGLAVATSCFSTRDAAAPTTGSGDVPLNPLSASDVLYNMEVAIKQKDPVYYEELFSEAFRFSPSSSDSAEVEKDFPGAFSNWDKAVETGVMTYILDPVRSGIARLNLLEEILDFTDTTYEYQVDYDLILEHLDEEGTPTYMGYYGQARLFLRKLPDGYWYIERWSDFNEPPEVSWGRLKGETRGRM